MNRLEFSPKQRQVLDWWRQDGFDAVICDGAVRSGKTFALGLSFFLWAMARFQRPVSYTHLTLPTILLV